MQSSIKNTVLQILTPKASRGYTVLELEDILNALPTDIGLQKSTLRECLQELQEESCISIKYLDAENCCLMVLQMGKEAVTKFEESQKAVQQMVQPVERMAAIVPALPTKKMGIKGWLMQFSAAFSGGFLAGLITLVVVLCTK